MVTQTSPLIHIKGIRDGLLITVEAGPYEEILAQLKQEVGQKASFLQGSRIVLAVGQRPLHVKQLSEIQALLSQHDLTLWTVLADEASTRTAARRLNLGTRLPGSQTDLDGNAYQANAAAEAEETAVQSDALLLRETLRSGRSVYHEGHIVVIGDVNPGAKLIASGNILVWGRLRGFVHAGALGDETAVICALQFAPTQLRIADYIAIPPDERHRQPVPEQASVHNGQILVDSWSVRS